MDFQSKIRHQGVEGERLVTKGGGLWNQTSLTVVRFPLWLELKNRVRRRLLFFVLLKYPILLRTLNYPSPLRDRDLLILRGRGLLQGSHSIHGRGIDLHVVLLEDRPLRTQSNPLFVEFVQIGKERRSLDENNKVAKRIRREGRMILWPLGM